MRHIRGVLAAAAAGLLAIMPSQPAVAAPHPLSAEWWFSAWGVQNDVWPVTKGGGVTVALLDTGVNAVLPELSGVVLKGGDSTGEKTDGRKDLDDRNGGHGTGMAALIAGQGGGRSGYVGIAPDAKILPIHDAVQFGDKIDGFESFAIGIRFAVDHGAKVINISEGVTSETMKDHCEPRIQEAIGYAIDHDVVIVASSGDSGNTSNWAELPGSCAGVVTVGGFGPDLHAWNGTQRQPYVAIAAPGSRIPTIGKHGQYFPDGEGTSASAALTSGAVALIRAANPHMPARTVVQRLIATARPLGKARWNDRTGYGAIQITAAMNPSRYPVAVNAPNPVYASFDKWRASQRGTRPSPPGPEHSPLSRSRSTGGGTVLPLIVASAVVLVVAIVVTIGISRRRRSRERPQMRHQRPENETLN